MSLSRIALAAVFVSTFGASAAMAECGFHQQSVKTESSIASSEGGVAQTPIPEGSLAAVPEEAVEPVVQPPRTAAPKSE